MFILDTNVISELRRGKPKQSAAVCAWAARQPINTLYLSAITVLEMEIGVRLMERKDAEQGRVLRVWTEQVAEAFKGRVLVFSQATARACAPLHVPDRKSFRDSMIAATALEHRFAVATRNVGDFAIDGLRVVDPWDFE